MQIPKASRSLKQEVINSSSIIKPLHARSSTNHPPEECQYLAPPPMTIPLMKILLRLFPLSVPSNFLLMMMLFYFLFLSCKFLFLHFFSLRISSHRFCNLPPTQSFSRKDFIITINMWFTIPLWRHQPICDPFFIIISG